MNAGAQAIYARLLEVAKSGGVTYYSEIALLAGLSWTPPGTASAFLTSWATLAQLNTVPADHSCRQ